MVVYSSSSAPDCLASSKQLIGSKAPLLGSARLSQNTLLSSYTLKELCNSLRFAYFCLTVFINFEGQQFQTAPIQYSESFAYTVWARHIWTYSRGVTIHSAHETR